MTNFVLRVSLRMGWHKNPIILFLSVIRMAYLHVPTNPICLRILREEGRELPDIFKILSV